MDEPGGRMENKVHLICDEDFKPLNFDDNKEIPVAAGFRSGDLKRRDAVDLDGYMNTLPDPKTLREKILSWFSDTSDRVKILANTKFSDNYINNTLLKGHNHES